MSQQDPSQPAANSAFWKEYESWKGLEKKDVATVPQVGHKVPSSAEIPLPDARLTLIVFLRHCGCPFAEKTFKNLTALSDRYKDVHCIAVSHSSAEATDKWLPQVGGSWAVDMIVDEERELYAKWGLGPSTTWHVANPRILWSAFRLGKDEGIWNRATESGSRWQTGGAFAVDRDGTLRWAHVATAADDLPNLRAALDAIGATPTEASE